MKIRDAEDRDLPGLLTLTSESWGAQVTKEFNERFDKNIYYLVAEVDRKIVGQILAWKKGTQGKPYLSALRVHKDQRNKGIGTRLIVEAEQKLKENGATEIHISVDVGNERALRLYKGLGYLLIGQRIEHWSRAYQGKSIDYDIELIDLEKRI